MKKSYPLLWLCLLLAIAQTANAQPVVSPTSIAQCQFDYKTFTLSGCHHYTSSPAIGGLFSSGTYTVYVIVSTNYVITGYNADNTVCGTVNLPVTVNPSPTTPTIVTGTVTDPNGNAPFLCKGGSVTLSVPPNPNYSYTWSPSTYLNTTTGPSVTATFTSAPTSGSIQYTVKATDITTGCMGESSTILYVDDYLDFTITSPTVVYTCPGRKPILNVKTTANSGEVQWSPTPYATYTTDTPTTGHFDITVGFIVGGGPSPQTKTIYVGTYNGKCFGPTQTITVKVYESCKALDALPVTLTSFTGQSSNNQNELRWQTAEEVQNEGFEVERSSNAKSFERIGFVKGALESKEANNYNFTDSQPLAGTNYYRLKQLDSDGGFAYSRIIAIMPTSDESLLVLYPNPTTDEITIRCNEGQIKEAQLYTTAGMMLAQKTATDSGDMLLSLKNMPSDTYLLVVAIDDYYVTKKVIKQ